VARVAEEGCSVAPKFRTPWGARRKEKAGRGGDAGMNTALRKKEGEGGSMRLL